MTPADRAMMDRLKVRADALQAWQPDPDAPPFFGLARDVEPERFKPRKLSWLGRLWLRVRLWWWS